MRPAFRRALTMLGAELLFLLGFVFVAAYNWHHKPLAVGLLGLACVAASVTLFVKGAHA